MEALIPVLNSGYIRFIEAWGHGDAGQEVANALLDPESKALIGEDMECGIIEAARQSTQGSFRGWEPGKCITCNGTGKLPKRIIQYDDRQLEYAERNNIKLDTTYEIEPDCPDCAGKGKHLGDEKLLRTLFCNKPPHATPFEFAGMVIEIQAPIFVFREWHRHRTQSYNEMSARYAPMPDNNYVPTVERCLIVSGKNKQAGAVKGSDEVTHESALAWLEELAAVYEHCERVYQSGLKRGLPKEVARICIPVGRYSRMRASTCLRNWFAFLTLRNDPGAQIEIQEYAKVVASIIERKFPRTYKLFMEGRIQ